MPKLCEICKRPDEPVNPDYDDELVLAYERKRSAGGGNAFRLRQPQQKWAHRHCVDRETKKINANQVALMALSVLIVLGLLCCYLGV